jgi:predicted transcriptional regulator
MTDGDLIVKKLLEEQASRQPRALAALKESSRPMYAREVAKAIGVGYQIAKNVLHALDKQGLVESEIVVQLSGQRRRYYRPKTP